MKQCIVVTYKNGSSINLDVPELYYQEKYAKKPAKKCHAIFLKEYNKFVNALNKTDGILQVGKYLKFSNATVSGKDVLSIDIKELAEEVKPVDNTIFVPGVHDKVYLDFTDTKLEALLTKLEDLSLLENLDKLVQKLVSYFNKANVEFSIKAGKKAPATPRKKKATPMPADLQEPVEAIPAAETAPQEQQEN